MSYYHVPILLHKAVKILRPKPGGTYIDATLGGSGHFLEILKNANYEGTFIGIDQDKTAIENAKKILSDYPGDIRLVHDNFSNIKEIVKKNDLDRVDGVMFDLGVSSKQLDEGIRGFSYMQDAPLDMRMDKRNTLHAGYVVNNLSKSELEKIILEYGEEPWAKRIADFICVARKRNEITTTGELVKIIKAAIPSGARRRGGHPARKTFQALRIYVNRELEVLSSGLKDTVKLLSPNGRVCVISFHSLEDRIVKDTFRFLASGCVCPKEALICNCGHKKQVNILTKKPIYPTAKEVEINPRARSAKLRAACKLSVLKSGKGE